MVDANNELKKAIEKLADLLTQKERLEDEVARQRRKVAAWRELCDAEQDRDVDVGMKACSDAFTAAILNLGGLSDACRSVMRSSRKEWLTITEIQTGLKEIGFSLDAYKAPYASIATTVNRMADGENAEVVVARRTNPGATEYKWVGAQYGAQNSLANLMLANAEINESVSKMLGQVRSDERPNSTMDLMPKRRIRKL